ncbi:hypothetical protein [Streptomyces alkaliterrae]|uniref:Uncharacterized protein n=1 Tax=Streptomyces alkaliterrae TaxID=2213162 RepID=A0A5P0YRI6_9ACTN|nr:hypothetical protein [Streptomyces alkaliterrae]MBB1258428.1 hypothetical protein [Streptomyces alkaliterrae]MQS02885.1 hypothetical protein [Streptomyces alkaliterrae]
MRDREKFIDEVARVVDRAPWIGVALWLQAAMAGLAVVVGVGLYLLIRRRAPGLALGGMVVLLLWDSSPHSRRCSAAAW